jgi:tRNA pseudouridine55 synthase
VHQGILLIDKPSGWTSFDVVNYVRGIIATIEGKKSKNIKVGHSGTLDPFATGLLILLVGNNYTRQAATFTKKDKTYLFCMRLGQESTTGDPEGEISLVSEKVPLLQEIEEALKGFKGNIEQTPPIYSAIKVNGQRAYNLARSGQKPKLEPRQVVINSLELVSFKYPNLVLRADVSSGTYIRSLGEDIGSNLGTGAYVSTLRRESIGDHNVTQAVEPKLLDSDNIASFIKTI